MTVRVVPWVRRGLATEVSADAVDGQTTAVRATASIEVKATANDGALEVSAGAREVQLYGPGDVAAIEEHQIRHRFPSPGAPDAEWNYFAFVEFDAADLPWRYSPAGPGQDGIAPPWLALVVVEDGVEAEFESGRRLPVLRVATADHLPPPTELWAWAHAFGEGDPTHDVDAFSARVMCPRRLRPHTNWRACVVPAFRTGRNVGLGLPAGDDPGPAWQPGDSDVELPVYSTWTFRTGELEGTFLSLAQQLVPRELGPEVGVRRLDLSAPGPPLPSERDAAADFVGAMYSAQYDGDTRGDATAEAFADSYRAQLTSEPPTTRRTARAYDASVDDPVVRLPLYGSPQRRGEALPVDDGDDHWYATLNTQAVHRSVAALGAEVVRNDQEALLAAAWEHAAALTQINEALQRARLAEETGRHRSRKFETLESGQRFQVAGPAVAQLDAGSTTLAGALADAAISTVVAGGSFRRMTRPGGVFQRATAPQPGTATAAPADHFAQETLSNGASAFTVALPEMLPAGLDIGVRVEATTPLSGSIDLGAFQTLEPGNLSPVPGSGGTLDVVWGAPTAAIVIGTTRQVASATVARSAVHRPASVPRRRTAARAALTATTPRRSTTFGLGGGFGAPASEPFPPGWAVDNNIPVGDVLPEIRERILDQITRVVAERPGDVVRRGTPATPLPALDVDVGDLMTSQVDPTIGVRAWVDAHIARTDDGGQRGLIDGSDPIPTALTARPAFHVPMYERLRALSVEYIVPGVGSVPPNSVGALSVNDAFVEAFLVGANHELSCEFRWREYPAPLHLTWFDQFWDVGQDGPADIAPIGTWKRTALGEHARGGDRLVVLVKGELIERFPNVLVYMVEAQLDGSERVMSAADPLPPVFSGRLQPGLHFYGFELPAGESPAREAQFGGRHQQGWFFGLEEQPRSPRFGLNVGESKDVGTVPDEAFRLSWRHLREPGGEPPAFVDRARTPAVLEGHQFDTGGWFADAATMAATTYRRPTRVLIHATALLEGG